MSFDLHITISGLCHFVRDDDRRLMHVLMPITSGVVDEHYPVLFFDGAYTKEGSRDFSRDIWNYDLSARRVEFPGLDTEFDPTLPCETLPVGGCGYNWDKLREKEVDDCTDYPPNAPACNTRVTFRDGMFTDYSCGAWFQLPDEQPPRRLANVHTWTIRGIEQRSLGPISILDAHGGPALGAAKGAGATTVPLVIPELFPIRRTIHLSIAHTVVDELPTDGWLRFPASGKPGPKEAQSADQVQAFGEMYTRLGHNGHTTNSWPALCRDKQTVNWIRDAAGCFNPDVNGGHAHMLGLTATCIGSSGLACDPTSGNC